jgi:hypothetical protein
MDSKRKEEDPKDYKLEFIHDSRRVVTLFLVLCKRSRDSTVTTLLQSSTEGCLFSKITSFLIDQMAQQIRMKMSRAKLTF